MATRTENEELPRTNSDAAVSVTSTLQSSLHIVTLAGFAIAQPLFDILARHPEFFVARQSSSAEILLFVGAVLLLIPAIILAVEWATGLLFKYLKLPARTAVRACIVAALMLLIALPIVKRIADLSDVSMLLAAALVAVVTTLAYLSLALCRRFLTILSPAAIVFPLLFLLTPAIQSLLFVDSTGPSAGSRGGENAPPAASPDAPVIFVVFDELPSTSLMTSSGAIDAQRFKNFAALAEKSHWFRNATTASDTTLWSLPAILSGKTPVADTLATSSDHPDNLFSWLGESHRLNVTEQVTNLCPQRLCPERAGQSPIGRRLKELGDDLLVIYQHHVLPERYAAHLPAIDFGWKNFRHSSEGESVDSVSIARGVKSKVHQNRKRKFEEFLASIQPDELPVLHFFHSMLPHSPYDYLPSGQIYGVTSDLPGIDNGWWTGDPWVIDRNYLRHLMQVQFVDKLLGRLVARLKEVELFDKAMIVIVADHGVSFEQGTSIRALSDANSHNILPVPFFLKTPHQSSGEIHDENISLVDVVATMADGLDRDPPWNNDGKSALDKTLTRDTLKTIIHKRGSQSLNIRLEDLVERRRQVIEHKERLLSDAAQTPGLLAQRKFAKLIGRPVSELENADRVDVNVIFDHQAFFDNTDLESHFIPLRVRGRVLLGQTSEPDYVAVAVNGTLWAIDEPTEILNGVAHIRSFIPVEALRAGRNETTAWLVYGRDPDNLTFAATSTTEKQLSAWKLQTNWLGQFTGIVNADGEFLPVTNGAGDGWLDQVRLQEGVVKFSGWAAKNDRSDTVEQVALFVDGDFLLAGSPNTVRNDVELATSEAQAQLAGFNYHVPLSGIPSGVSDDVRAFAISKGGEMYELKYPEKYQWTESE